MALQTSSASPLAVLVSLLIAKDIVKAREWKLKILMKRRKRFRCDGKIEEVQSSVNSLALTKSRWLFSWDQKKSKRSAGQNTRTATHEGIC